MYFFQPLGTMYEGTTKTYCGAYKANTGDGKWKDALIIQSLVTKNSQALSYSNICGQSGFGTGAAFTPATICCEFSSNNIEEQSQMIFFQPSLFHSL